MYPLALVTLAAALLGLWLATSQPQEAAFLRNVQAESHAANFWAYHDALVHYQNDHFQTASGFIPDALLTLPNPPGRPNGYVPLGYTVMKTADLLPTSLWSNYIEGSRLYTFSSIPAKNLPAGTLDAIASYHGSSLMVGIRQGDRIKTQYELDTPPYTATGTFFPSFPAQIPDGAVVVVSN